MIYYLQIMIKCWKNARTGKIDRKPTHAQHHLPMLRHQLNCQNRTSLKRLWFNHHFPAIDTECTVIHLNYYYMTNFGMCHIWYNCIERLYMKWYKILKIEKKLKYLTYLILLFPGLPFPPWSHSIPPQGGNSSLVKNPCTRGMVEKVTTIPVDACDPFRQRQILRYVCCIVHVDGLTYFTPR